MSGVTSFTLLLWDTWTNSVRSCCDTGMWLVWVLQLPECSAAPTAGCRACSESIAKNGYIWIIVAPVIISAGNSSSHFCAVSPTDKMLKSICCVYYLFVKANFLGEDSYIKTQKNMIWHTAEGVNNSVYTVDSSGRHFNQAWPLCSKHVPYKTPMVLHGYDKAAIKLNPTERIQEKYADTFCST